VVGAAALRLASQHVPAGGAVGKQQPHANGRRTQAETAAAAQRATSDLAVSAGYSSEVGRGSSILERSAQIEYAYSDALLKGVWRRASCCRALD